MYNVFVYRVLFYVVKRGLFVLDRVNLLRMELRLILQLVMVHLLTLRPWALAKGNLA